MLQNVRNQLYIFLIIPFISMKKKKERKPSKDIFKNNKTTQSVLDAQI